MSWRWETHPSSFLVDDLALFPRTRHYSRPHLSHSYYTSKHEAQDSSACQQLRFTRITILRTLFMALASLPDDAGRNSIARQHYPQSPEPRSSTHHSGAALRLGFFSAVRARADLDGILPTRTIMHASYSGLAVSRSTFTSADYANAFSPHDYRRTISAILHKELGGILTRE